MRSMIVVWSDLRRQRQLNQDAVHLGIGAQRVDELGGGGGWEVSASGRGRTRGCRFSAQAWRLPRTYTGRPGLSKPTMITRLTGARLFLKSRAVTQFVDIGA